MLVRQKAISAQQGKDLEARSTTLRSRVLKDDAIGELSSQVTELERQVRRLQLEHQGVSQQLAARVLEAARLPGELEAPHAENVRPQARR